MNLMVYPYGEYKRSITNGFVAGLMKLLNGAETHEYALELMYFLITK